MIYTVYIWKRLTSEAAEIVKRVETPNAEAAVQEVLIEQHVSRAYYAWASPDDETVPAEDFYDMHCVMARRAGH